MISALITLVIYIIVLALVWWLVNYILDNFPLPEPANKLIRVGIVVVIVIIVAVLLIELFAGGTTGIPRLRFG
jgi:hypothetical protein